ncbi:MAG: hypothetical protein DWQ51_08775 [Microcystis wesenbergii TW10]|uniref:Uncharacterized protein n=2 Tax=Microcystis TaxID=1125 RepID=A0A552ABY6_MICAE|nr:MAG: hypothetical protein DWQ51_08775 [Microcystis wesenbergii TW10]TRT82954.1 MAG: hypothetical protein EWV63_18485 [Microcystis aeruginosa Ma_OC_H_19870700_S124]
MVKLFVWREPPIRPSWHPWVRWLFYSNISFNERCIDRGWTIAAQVHRRLRCYGIDVSRESVFMFSRSHKMVLDLSEFIVNHIIYYALK